MEALAPLAAAGILTYFEWDRIITHDDVLEAELTHPGESFGKPNPFLLHQANRNLTTRVAQGVGAPVERFVSNVERYGNTSAGSIPLVLDEAMQEGRIQPNDLVVLSGFGSGLAWGTALMRW